MINRQRMRPSTDGQERANYGQRSPICVPSNHVSRFVDGLSSFFFTAFSENLVRAPFLKKNLGGRTAATVVYRQWGLQQRWQSILVMHTCAHSNNLYIWLP